MLVLIVEDNRGLACGIGEYLEMKGIQSDFASSGEQGVSLAVTNHYDAIILDIMLPRMDGFAVCSELRQAGINTPVLMLTARDELDDRLAGFDCGADDYLVKPFAMAELVARLQAVTNRRHGVMGVLSVADLELHIDSGKATRGGVALELTPIGWKILLTMVRASPNVVAREALIQSVWGDDPPDTDALKTHLWVLRRAVDQPFDRQLVHTVRGRGFSLRE